MGVARLIFQPHPPNFANLYNFYICTNDIIMIFFIHLLVSNGKRIIIKYRRYMGTRKYSDFYKKVYVYKNNFFYRHFLSCMLKICIKNQIKILYTCYKHNKDEMKFRHEIHKIKKEHDLTHFSENPPALQTQKTLLSTVSTS